MDRADFRRRSRDAFYRQVEGGAVVFHPASKRLFALNEAAALIWTAVQAGEADETVIATLRSGFSLSEGQAVSWLNDTLSMLDQPSVTEALPAFHESDGRGMAATRTVRREHAYRLLDRTIGISAPPGAMDAIDSLLGNLKLPPASGAEQCDFLFEVVEADDGYDLTGPYGKAAGIDASALAAEIEQMIIQAVVPEVPHLLAFHAAMASRDDRGILLSAPSGSGKTTLSVFLARHGWQFCSDELALLGRDLLWRGVPLPPCIKAESYGMVRQWWPLLDSLPEHHRFTRRVKFLKLPESKAPAPIQTVIFPRFRVGAAIELEPVEPLDGIARLLSECIFIPADFKSEDVRLLLAWHDGADYWQLSFGNPQEAADAINRLPPGLDG